jgi:hypothetical protein
MFVLYYSSLNDMHLLFFSTNHGIHILPRSYQQCMHHLHSISFGFLFVLFCFGTPILNLCKEAELQPLKIVLSVGPELLYRQTCSFLNIR